MKNKILGKVEALVKKHMMGEGTGHDWWHLDRVRRNALLIWKSEKRGDPFIIQAAALVHDVDDWKFRKTKLPLATIRILRQAGANDGQIREILDITENMSFKLGLNPKILPTWEGRIVQDADRLDAIGAIGVARLFAFGGKMGREIHNPNKKLKRYRTLKNFKWQTNTSLHHFEEKLLYLKDRMNTKSGKKLARQRHEFMVAYLNEFHREWKGLG